MLSNLSMFPRVVTIEDTFDDILSDIFDPILPVGPYFGTTYSPYNHRSPCRRNVCGRANQKKYQVSIVVGGYYTPKDIQVSLEGNKLKVSGKAVEELRNGANHHEFNREYEIPEDVDQATMKSELTPHGEFRVTFDRKKVEPKKELEFLSTDDQFHVVVRLPGFKPEEMTVKIVGRNLVIEAEHKSHQASENGNSYSSMSGHISRHLHLGEDVDVDKLSARIGQDASLEIKAPRDPKKAKPEPRVLPVEKS